MVEAGDALVHVAGDRGKHRGGRGRAGRNPARHGSARSRVLPVRIRFRRRARLEPAIPALGPSVRALIARNLIRLGQDFHEIELRDGRPVLIPVGYSYPYSQSPDPMRWLYQASVYTPSGSRHRWVLGGAMLHTKYAVDPERPWIGIPPWRWASSSGVLAGALERRLGEEASGPVAHLLPVPQDGGDGSADDPLSMLKADIAKGRGKTLLIETTSAGWGEGRTAAPAEDLKPRRIGANPPVTLPSLRSGRGVGRA